uniref:uncharacterized protein LOC120343011 n=1 Tax=Styela clava TaxID=7725 RepID=UPI0019392CB0|nr:uncharacterized protein LOC120343011 [Styela clava]
MNKLQTVEYQFNPENHTVEVEQRNFSEGESENMEEILIISDNISPSETNTVKYKRGNISREKTMNLDQHEHNEEKCKLRQRAQNYLKRNIDNAENTAKLQCYERVTDEKSAILQYCQKQRNWMEENQDATEEVIYDNLGDFQKWNKQLFDIMEQAVTTMNLEQQQIKDGKRNLSGRAKDDLKSLIDNAERKTKLKHFENLINEKSAIVQHCHNIRKWMEDNQNATKEVIYINLEKFRNWIKQVFERMEQAVKMENFRLIFIPIQDGTKEVKCSIREKFQSQIEMKLKYLKTECKDKIYQRIRSYKNSENHQGETQFEYNCNGPVIAGLPYESHGKEIYRLEGFVFSNPARNSFALAFFFDDEIMQQKVVEYFNRRGFTEEISFNTQSIKPDDKIKAEIACENQEFKFSGNGTCTFEIDDDFLEFKNWKRFFFPLEYGNHNFHAIQIKCNLHKNGTLLDGNQSFNYPWIWEPAHSQPSGSTDKRPFPEGGSSFAPSENINVKGKYQQIIE